MDSDDALKSPYNNMEKQGSSLSIRKDKGVAGLTILMAVVLIVFIIGFLVMIFAIIGSSLFTSTTTTTPTTVTDESGAFINSSGYTVVASTQPGFRTFVITSARNATFGVINSANFTYTQAGVVTNSTIASDPGFWTAVFLNYTYVYDANNTATNVITTTTTSLAGVTAWFPIIITITVMVALILLTVIIIVAIRSSGLLGGNQ